MRLMTCLLAAWTLALAGCGGLVAFDVDSTPPGARVYVDDTLIGTTPTGVVVRRLSEPQLGVTLEKMGYKPIAVFMTVRLHESEQAAREGKVTLDLDLERR